MARIRTIKPEFWTSVQIAECSPNARLLFIGMWNFCDDYGVHPASEMRLKMEVFPSDAFSKQEIQLLIGELIDNGLIQEYEINSTKYWFVTGWSKHQNIESPTGKFPMPNGEVGEKIRGRTNHPNYRRSPEDQKELREHSSNVSRTSEEHSPTVNQKEKEKEKEKDVETNPLSDSANTDGVVLKNGKAKFQADAESVIVFLNEKTGSHYRPVKANLELVAERLKEGYSVSDCRAVVVRKTREWKGTDMEKYLRPATLFSRTNFAQYSGEVAK